MKNHVSMLILLIPAPAVCQPFFYDGIQTDWSGGPGVPEQQAWPQSGYCGWDSTFYASSRVDFSGSPGEMSLSLVPVAWTVDSIITADAGIGLVLEPADIDGDLVCDIVGADRNTAVIRWWGDASTGPGHAWTEHEIATLSFNVDDFCTCDIEVDGDIDILAGAEELGWLENAGAGTTWLWHQIAPSSVEVSFVALSDADSDGDADAAACHGDGTVFLYRNSDSGQTWVGEQIATGLLSPHFISFADIDSDFSPDLVVKTWSSIVWLENPFPSGGAWPVHEIAEQYSSYSGLSAVVDMDLDGDPDIVTRHQDLWWWENDQSGQQWWNHCIDPGSSSLKAVIDFDSDSDPDLLVSAGSESTMEGLCLLENLDSEGLDWGWHSLWTPGIWCYSAAIGDFDGTGEAEVAARLDPQPSSGDSTALAWLPLLGHPTWGWLESSSLQIPVPTDEGPVYWGAITWSADQPAGSQVYFRVRNGMWDDWSDPILLSGTDLEPLLDGWPEVQYKAEFLNPDPLSTPVLHEVGIQWFVYPGGVEQQGDAPEDYYLGKPRPNPGSGPVSLQFGIPCASRVSIRVYDVAGRTVDEDELDLAPGSYSWLGSVRQPGVYFVVLDAGVFRAVERFAAVE